MSFQLATSEQLLIYRLRKKRFQNAMAEQLNVPYTKYLAMEKGYIPEGKTLPKYITNIKTVTKLEQCILLRRRAELSQKQLGLLMKCSRQWVNQMETGQIDAARLFDHWKL